ncbi:sodium:proton antiporter [Rhabdobacter roseus]|uniref:CPA1 family monovalent cation:H+ antiporter n=1 Tax=Rhabdobacter roseus TaxID=1655419 RepID=A0A840U0I5_9BACT|nr:sodium:proton antiporter [Rhabdobacter roseus]MBB5285650.1 CPA1 family monovalent cation:H+ antiporter [Rhabdobacter roseus]
MDLFTIVAILTTVCALFAYINYRFVKLPTTIGLMLIALLFSIVILIVGHYNPAVLEGVKGLVSSIDFPQVLLEVLLSFLLFAGALHTDIDLMREQKWTILSFATIGVLLSTFLVGIFFYYLFGALEYQVPFIHCLLLGALISPTDPIAVLGILKKAKVPKNLEIVITGESLFNDGVGVVVFLTILQIATLGPSEVTPGEIGLLFLEEVGGGIVLGLVLGYLTYRLMRSIDHYQTEVLLSLALVMGGYALASALHFSGPLAVVVAGLFIGNRGRTEAMSDATVEYVDKFWELVDEFLNAMLFVLIGLEIVIITFLEDYWLLGLLGIVINLLARWISVSVPILFLRKSANFMPQTPLIMTWGGLRGGISIALALSLPAAMNKDIILTITYCIVIFSILVQGLSLGAVVKRVKVKYNL